MYKETLSLIEQITKQNVPLNPSKTKSTIKSFRKKQLLYESYLKKDKCLGDHLL